MNPNARIYPIYVLDEVIKGDKVEVGAAGSHNDVALEIEFSANWEGLAKKIYWENANGTPGGFTLLLPSMLEPERDDVYLVPIPAQAKDAPGWMKMSIKGTKLVDGEEVLIRMSETGRFKLLKSNYNQWGGPDVGPDQATQLQDEIEKLTADVPRQIEAHNTDPEAHADIREALERHTEDWDNPHHVTAAQVHSKMTLVFTGTITAGKPVRLTVDKPFSYVLEALQKGVVVDAMYESTVLRLSSFSDYAMNFVCAPYSVKNADKFLSINFTSSDMAYGVLLDLGNSEDNIQEVFTAHITDEVGRAVCDMTASEIIDADRIGVVKAEYTDPATEEIRTYYYFKQTKDRRAVFSKDGYIEDGVAKSSLIYVDSNGYVTVETRPLRLPVGFATCDDVADSPTSASNVWYIPKTVPRPSGIPGMMLDVKWTNGHVGGLGYNVTLIWGEAGGADNETIVGQSSVSGGPQDVSIPVGGTVRYQLVDSGSRMSWKYVSGSLLKKQYSTATAPDTVKKVVPGLSGGYLPGMDIYLQVDKGSTASTMTLVPDDGKTLPVYGNGKGKATGNIPTGYILHLKNAGDHWQILNQPGGSEGSEIVRYTCSDAANEAEKVQLAKTRATPPALKDTFIVSFTEGNTASAMNLHFGSAVYAVTGDLAMSPGYEAQFYVTKHDPAGLSNEVILLNPDSSIPIRELNESLGYVTPQMYGAKGDGVTNDAKAFRDAAATGQEVFAPPGKYLIEDNGAPYKLRVRGAGTGKTVITVKSLSIKSGSRISDLYLSVPVKPINTSIMLECEHVVLVGKDIFRLYDSETYLGYANFSDINFDVTGVFFDINKAIQVNYCTFRRMYGSVKTWFKGTGERPRFNSVKFETIEIRGEKRPAVLFDFKKSWFTSVNFDNAFFEYNIRFFSGPPTGTMTITASWFLDCDDLFVYTFPPEDSQDTMTIGMENCAIRYSGTTFEQLQTHPLFFNDNPKMLTLNVSGVNMGASDKDHSSIADVKAFREAKSITGVCLSNAGELVYLGFPKIWNGNSWAGPVLQDKWEDLETAEIKAPENAFKRTGYNLKALEIVVEKGLLQDNSLGIEVYTRKSERVTGIALSVPASGYARCVVEANKNGEYIAYMASGKNMYAYTTFAMPGPRFAGVKNDSPIFSFNFTTKISAGTVKIRGIKAS